MKLLIFANSDSSGTVIAGHPWPKQIVAAVEREASVAVELVERGFSAVGGDPVSYAERVVQKERPDVVILPLTTYSFAVQFVAPRIRQLLGERAWSRYRAIESRFDRGTRSTRLLKPINRVGRKAARRLIGTAPLATPSAVTQVYAETIRCLARMEDLHLIAMTYPRFGRDIEAANPGIADRVRAFELDIRRVVNEHRFTWADGQAALDAAGVGDDAAAPDGFHLSDTAHRVYGDMLAPLVLAAVKGDREGFTRSHT